MLSLSAFDVFEKVFNPHNNTVRGVFEWKRGTERTAVKAHELRVKISINPAMTPTTSIDYMCK